MKNITPALKSHIAGDLQNMATCWLLTRRDGVRLAFSTHDQELRIENLVFQPSNSFLPTHISSSNRLNVDNLDVTSILSSSAISEKDILAGRYDHARIEIFQVNWADPAQGKLYLRVGWIGEITVKDDQFVAEVRGMMQKMQQVVGTLYSPECRVDLGSVYCHVNLEAFSVLGKVTSSSGPRLFYDQDRLEADGWYDYGLLRWVTGANAGKAVEVKTFSGGSFKLYDPMHDLIAAGDIYKVYAGCDKRSVTCKNKFANFENFKGETAIPGNDSLYNYPGLK